MPEKTYRTAQLAREVGIHPNTVMRYIEWGLIPSVERAPNGYRIYTQKHLDCLKLARKVYSSYYPGKALRASATMMIEAAAADDWPGALDLASKHLAHVESEIELAEKTVRLLEDWVETRDKARSTKYYTIGQTCALLDVTHDVLRNWERNGLIRIQRNPANGYRQIGEAEIERLRIIRLLSHAGYSMMAMLRMFLQLDSGNKANLRQALDTPNPDEDVYMAANRWLTVLNLQRESSREIIQFINEVVERTKGDKTA